MKNYVIGVDLAAGPSVGAACPSGTTESETVRRSRAAAEAMGEHADALERAENRRTEWKDTLNLLMAGNGRCILRVAPSADVFRQKSAMFGADSSGIIPLLKRAVRDIEEYIDELKRLTTDDIIQGVAYYDLTDLPHVSEEEVDAAPSAPPAPALSSADAVIAAIEHLTRKTQLDETNPRATFYALKGEILIRIGQYRGKDPLQYVMGGDAI